MRWEELTGDLFPQAVQQAEGVCLLPLSCIERHGHHLPLGTDMYIARELCNRAADLEPAIIFPDFIFTQILTARHVPGTISIEPDLTIRLMENACSEIARNGLRKIVIVNAHGGNDNLIRYFAQIQLASQRDYVVYVAQPPYVAEEASTAAQWETNIDGHAGERETSMILAIWPDMVRMEALPSDSEGMPLERLKTLRDLGISVGIRWYAEHPTHYCGDGFPATAEKGERWFVDRSNALARVIRAIKNDEETKRLQDEFFEKI
ncbi:MAG: creatininase family protein [Anaerolineales bacterium]|jgi:creatinine amidohydrolase